MNFLQQLMMARWDTDRAPIQTNHCLFLDGVGMPDYLVNARKFLVALSKENGTTATAAGNLNRAFVSEMFKQMRLTKSFREDVRTVWQRVDLTR